MGSATATSAAACANKGKLTGAKSPLSTEARLVNPDQATSQGQNARLGWFWTVRQGTYDAQRLLSEPPCLQIRLITHDWLG
jgi:hypothetical protein